MIPHNSKLSNKLMIKGSGDGLKILSRMEERKKCHGQMREREVSFVILLPRLIVKPPYYSIKVLINLGP